MLICPRCNELLIPQTFGESPTQGLGPYRSPSGHSPLDPNAWQVDLCAACGGIWFDAGELAKALQEKVPSGMVVEASTTQPLTRLDREARMLCLRCRSPMEVVRSQAAPWLDYDRCPRCQGIWLDGDDYDRFDDPLITIFALASGEFA
jgi:uncharacterized protein